MNFGSKIELS